MGCGVPERRPFSLSPSHPGSLLTTGRDAAVLWERWGLQAVCRPSCLGWGGLGTATPPLGVLGLSEAPQWAARPPGCQRRKAQQVLNVGHGSLLPQTQRSGQTPEEDRTSALLRASPSVRLTAQGCRGSSRMSESGQEGWSGGATSPLSQRARPSLLPPADRGQVSTAVPTKASASPARPSLRVPGETPHHGTVSSGSFNKDVSASDT